MAKSIIQTLKSVSVAVFFIAALGLAGNADRTDAIICGMNPQVYELIKSLVGESDEDIADEYMENKGYYDTLADKNLW